MNYHYRKSTRGWDIIFLPSGATVTREATEEAAQERCRELNKEEGK